MTTTLCPDVRIVPEHVARNPVARAIAKAQMTEAVRDFCTRIYLPADALEACPCCGSSARVWEYVEKTGGPVVRVAMCDHEGSIGPRDALVYEGCLLQMPPDDFYRGTGRDAVRYWNGYAKALMAAQRANRC
jgi:hypothetical protein